MYTLKAGVNYGNFTRLKTIYCSGNFGCFNVLMLSGELNDTIK